MLLKSWISCTGVSLKKSSVPLDVKVFIMNMCFCLIRIAKIPEEEIEKTFQSLCQQVKIGIKNVIQSLSPLSVKVDALGHEVRVKEELEVSCYCRSVCCMFLNLWIYIYYLYYCCRCGTLCFQRICLWLQHCVRMHGLRSAARQ